MSERLSDYEVARVLMADGFTVPGPSDDKVRALAREVQAHRARLAQPEAERDKRSNKLFGMVVRVNSLVPPNEIWMGAVVNKDEWNEALHAVKIVMDATPVPPPKDQGTA